MACSRFCVPISRCCSVESAAALRKAGRSVAGILSIARLPGDADHRVEQVLGHPAMLDDLVDLLASTVAAVVLEAVDHAGLRGHVELAEWRWAWGSRP